MATYTYTGSDERVFPTLGVTVKSGDTFEGPDNLILSDVTASGSAPKPKAPEPTPSDADKNAGV
jgi:hypothetical protein